MISYEPRRAPAIRDIGRPIIGPLVAPAPGRRRAHGTGVTPENLSKFSMGFVHIGRNRWMRACGRMRSLVRRCVGQRLSPRPPIWRSEKVRRRERNITCTLPHHLVAASNDLRSVGAVVEGPADVFSGNDAVRHLEHGWKRRRPKWSLAPLRNARAALRCRTFEGATSLNKLYLAAALAGQVRDFALRHDPLPYHLDDEGRDRRLNCLLPRPATSHVDLFSRTRISRSTTRPQCRRGRIRGPGRQPTRLAADEHGTQGKQCESSRTGHLDPQLTVERSRCAARFRYHLERERPAS